MMVSLSFDTDTRRYPADKYPLMAFTGVPGELMISPDVQKLQKYMWWSEYVMRIVNKNVIKMHLKIGADTVRAIVSQQYITLEFLIILSL